MDALMLKPNDEATGGALILPVPAIYHFYMHDNDHSLTSSHH
jgi:hypothetical protein